MSSEEVKVSVIICALNRKRILPETISSIKKSSHVGELIVVEGLKPVGYARDVGWRKAQNPILCFIDDDEVVPEGWIERLAEEFKDPEIGAVSSTIKPLNETKINKLECILYNRTLEKFTAHTRCVRKKALEEIGGYEHTAGGETFYAARKLALQGWRIKIVNYPLLHKMHENGYAWILNKYGTGKIRAHELRERKELLTRFKRALGSFLRGFQFSVLYREPLFFVFFPLRCWLYLLGAIRGNLKTRKNRPCGF